MGSDCISSSSLLIFLFCGQREVVDRQIVDKGLPKTKTLRKFYERQHDLVGPYNVAVSIPAPTYNKCNLS